MRYCNQCHKITPGEPLFCNFCGRSYNLKLCPHRHPNPRSAEICSQCGSRELSTPHPRVPFLLLPLVWLLTALPGLLLVTGTLPYWQAVQHRPGIAAMMMGMNAAVVGLLGAAFINLLSVSTLHSFWDIPIAVAALALLTLGQARPILVVMFCAAAGAVI